MAGIKTCIKATSNLSDEDVAAVLEGFDSYKSRMKSKEATTLAIDDVILSVESERTEFLELVYETHPNTRTVAPKLSDEEITQKIQNKIDSDFDAVVQEYSEIPESHGGKVLSGDIAKELSEEYLVDRTKAAVVHEPTIQFTKDLYAQKLKEAPGPGEGPLVLFTAGGTGAGKTTGLALDGTKPFADSAQIIYDSNMRGFDSAVKKIEAAFTAGKDVHVIMVYREPVEAFVNGAIPRAIRQEKEFGTGRTVPIMEHINTHKGSAEVMAALTKRYQNDERFQLTIVDNSNGKGNTRLGNLELLKTPDYDSVIIEVKHELERLYEKGSISQSIYEGFSQEADYETAVQGGNAEILTDSGTEVRRQLEQTTQGAVTPPPLSLPTAALRGGEKLDTNLAVQPYDFIQHSPITKTKPKKRVETSTLRRLVDRLQRDLPSLSKVSFHIFDTQPDAFGPGSVEKHGVLEGGYYAGTDDILLIAEHIKDEDHALRVIRHETIGHYGLRQILNRDGAYDKLLARVYKARNGELKELYDQVAKFYPDLVRDNDVRTIADEMMARAAETKTETTLLKRIWDQIIKLLNQYGFGGKIDYSEVQSLIRSSEANLRKKVQAPTKGEEGQDLEKTEYDMYLEFTDDKKPMSFDKWLLASRGDARLLFSRAADEAEDAPTNGNLGMPDENLKDKFVRLAQDNFSRMKQQQKSIEEGGGLVSQEGDVYRAEERSSGKIAFRLKQLQRNYMDPLTTIMDENDITLGELDEYLVARHAHERNAWIAAINEDMPDSGSGMSNAKADEVLARARQGDKDDASQDAANIVYGVNDQNLDDRVAGGYMTQEAADGYRNRWDNYVPLKGNQEEEISGRPGSGFSIGKSSFKKALGRGEGNLPESPTAHSFGQAEETIVRSEKTKVGQALVQLVRDNPDPALWTITTRTYKKFVDLFGEPFEGYDKAPEGLIDGMDYHQIWGISAQESADAIAEGRKPEKKVVYMVDRHYGDRDDVFKVMLDAEELLIRIHDPVLVNQLKKMNTTQLSGIVRFFGQVNRYLAIVNTGMNPEFIITNFERDFQAAMINLGGEHSVAIAARVAKGVPGAIRGILQETFDTKGQSEWRDLWIEMESEGGSIGFFGLEDIETKVQNIQNSLINRHGVLGATKRGIMAVRDTILDANLSVENAARLSAYKVIKEEAIANGKSEKEAKQMAASVSKNLTVNFNRKGEWGPGLNSAYLFYNASIQGSARIITALAHPRVRKIVGSVVGISYALAMYNRASGDDDDGIPYYDKISDYTKQTNLIVMHPDGSGNFSKIRLPYGYNVFWYAGVEMENLAFNPMATVSKSAMNMGSAVLNAYNPIQGADLLDTVTPTVLKPWEQDVRNINFMASPLKPDNPFDNYDRPESQKAFKSTNPALKEMMELINEETGGDQTHSGLIDISPEIVKHYAGWLTGGAGQFVLRSAGTAINLATDEEIDMRNVPLLRTLGGKPGSSFDTQRFYDAIKEVNAVEAQLKIFKGTPEYSEYKADHSEVHKLSFRMKRYKNKVKRLRDKRDKAYAGDDTILANELREEIRQEMMKFSLLYDEASEEDL